MTTSFEQLAQIINNNFQDLSAILPVFSTNANKNELWDAYLSAFKNPEERQEHNCNACRAFIKTYGNTVFIDDDRIRTIWDVTVDNPTYQKAMNTLNVVVKKSSIRDVFTSRFQTVGVEKNFKTTNDEGVVDVKAHSHFFLEIPRKFYRPFENQRPSYRRVVPVFKRALDEISVKTVVKTIELVDENKLNRGTEFRVLLSKFLELKKQYVKLSGEETELFVWKKILETDASVTKIRNSAIGTVLINIENGDNEGVVVRKFNQVMDPLNYQRPTKEVSVNQIKKAEETIKELGMVESLERRLAVSEDVSINNLLWADRTTMTLETKNSIFAQLTKEATSKPKKNWDNLPTITLDDFLTNLPEYKSISLLLENNHRSNLVSLIAPCKPKAPKLTKWDNNFSWVYNGGIASSMKERIKEKGGKIEGELRCSLRWFNSDDLDIYLIEPNGYKIYHGDKHSENGGELDLDMNVSASGENFSRNAVENIIYANNKKILEGEYKLYVHNYDQRENYDVGFESEIECKNQLHKFHYKKVVRNHQRICVAKFKYSKKDGVTILNSLPPTQETTEKTLWNLKTNNFHPVTLVMNSPNHWEEQTYGEKNIFFMLKRAENNDSLIRGIFNEQLAGELQEHKKVFEKLGAKLQVEAAPSERQLSGLGFTVAKDYNIVVQLTKNNDEKFIIKITK